MPPWVTAALLALLLVSARSLAEQQERAEAAAAKAEVLERVVAPDATATPPEEPITEQEVQAVDPAGSDPLEELWILRQVDGRLRLGAIVNPLAPRFLPKDLPLRRPT